MVPFPNRLITHPEYIQRVLRKSDLIYPQAGFDPPKHSDSLLEFDHCSTSKPPRLDKERKLCHSIYFMSMVQLVNCTQKVKQPFIKHARLADFSKVRKSRDQFYQNLYTLDPRACLSLPFNRTLKRLKGNQSRLSFKVGYIHSFFNAICNLLCITVLFTTLKYCSLCYYTQNLKPLLLYFISLS